VNATASLDNIVAVVIPFVALLTSSPTMWRKERLCNFSIFDRVAYTLSILFNPQICQLLVT
jgi:hypothetical protein